MAEDVPGTPTDKTQKSFSEPLDSTHKINGSLYSSGRPSKHVTPFGQRTNKFAVKFNIDNLPNTENGSDEHDAETNEDDIVKRAQPQRCSLIIHGSKPEPGCRFMYDRIEDRVSDASYVDITVLTSCLQ